MNKKKNKNQSQANILLIVEDEDYLREIFAFKFSRAGYQVLEAANGQEAFIRLQSCCPQVVLLDLIMPQVTGWDVLEHIKSHEGTKDVPVILISNVGSEQVIQKGLEAGAAAYIVKSNIDMNEVVSVVENVLVKKSETSS